MQQSKVRLSEQQGVKVMLSTKQMTSDVKDLSLMSLKDLKDLIDSGLNINEQDEEGNTYLHQVSPAKWAINNHRLIVDVS